MQDGGGKLRQVLQNLKTGATDLMTGPAPSARPGAIAIATRSTLVSSGTERMLVDFGRGSYLSKMRQQPERVKSVLEKVTTDGLSSTVAAVNSKLDQPIPLGYSNAGVVTELGSGVTQFRVGDRVLSSGPHADVVMVPTSLCSRIPDNVSDEDAAFGVVASIGLEGVRLAQPTLGESFVVTGVGLVGLLTVQLLRANGCRVLAIDVNEDRLALAAQFGAHICNVATGEDPVAAALAFSDGRGVDGVLIAASTDSNEPVQQAAEMCRTRGRIVLIGVAGLQLDRAAFYAKELSFQVSCSYGPGRYDPAYEEQGHDYPYGYVRWTEQRNFEAVLQLMAEGKLDVRPLISHRFAFEDAPAAYETLVSDKSALGIILEYNSPDAERMTKSVEIQIVAPASSGAAAPVGIAFVGAGNYASRVLLPAFKKAGASLHTIVSSGGVSASISGRKFGFLNASTDLAQVLADPAVTAITVATRHDTHAALVSDALRAGKDVFVEKPIAIDEFGLAAVRDAYASAAGRPMLAVGFNRRFSPHVAKMRQLLSATQQPKAFIMTMNAGAFPAGHWTQDPAVGGGRIIGEACHFIDLMRFLADSPIASVQAVRMGNAPGLAIAEDKASITLRFADGSFGTILYLANGSARFPKERIEVFVDGKVLQLDNFRTLRGYGWRNFKRFKTWQQDKGQAQSVRAFVDSLTTRVPSIAPDQIFEVADATLEAARQLRAQ